MWQAHSLRLTFMIYHLFVILMIFSNILNELVSHNFHVFMTPNKIIKDSLLFRLNLRKKVSKVFEYFLVGLFLLSLFTLNHLTNKVSKEYWKIVFQILIYVLEEWVTKISISFFYSSVVYLVPLLYFLIILFTYQRHIIEHTTNKFFLCSHSLAFSFSM